MGVKQDRAELLEATVDRLLARLSSERGFDRHWVDEQSRLMRMMLDTPFDGAAALVQNARRAIEELSRSDVLREFDSELHRSHPDAGEFNLSWFCHLLEAVEALASVRATTKVSPAALALFRDAVLQSNAAYKNAQLSEEIVHPEDFSRETLSWIFLCVRDSDSTVIVLPQALSHLLEGRGLVEPEWIAKWIRRFSATLSPEAFDALREFFLCMIRLEAARPVDGRGRLNEMLHAYAVAFSDISPALAQLSLIEGIAPWLQLAWIIDWDYRDFILSNSIPTRWREAEAGAQWLVFERWIFEVALAQMEQAFFQGPDVRSVSMLSSAIQCLDWAKADRSH